MSTYTAISYHIVFSTKDRGGQVVEVSANELRAQRKPAQRLALRVPRTCFPAGHLSLSTCHCAFAF